MAGLFYPEDLPSKDKLKYFSQHFQTAEVNYSFYHLPRPSTYQNWSDQTPKDFIFAVKASRFITHIKRLKEVQRAWKIFLKNALFLKEKLGPILFQFPPLFKVTSKTLKRLEDFLKLITSSQISKKYTGVEKLPLKFAMEFRHKSWSDEKIYKLLKKYNVAWVIADSPRYPKAEVVTADFVYIRMHGSKALFSSKYTKRELQDLAKLIKRYLRQKKDVYVYFNNDFHAYAVENAKELIKILKI